MTKTRTPLVSIVMPVYNGASTIRLALQSLLAQTYSNWICIIVNDGSIDDTKKILDSLTDSRFRVYHLSKNMGRGYARQVALKHTDGEFIAYLDADDFYHSEKIKRQIDVMMSDPSIDLVACGLLTFGIDKKPINIRGKTHRNVKKYNDGDNLPITMPTALIRKEKAHSISYNSKLNAGEDLDYFSQYLDGGHYVNLDSILFYYFTGPTTYKKIVSYSYNDCLRGFILSKRKFLPGLKTIILGLCKLAIYAIFTPIMGVDYFINYRGKTPSQQDIDEYYKQLKLLK